MVLLPIILPLLQGCVPPSSSNGDSARGMLEDLDSYCAFWYTAVTRASAAFMAEIKTGTRMKELGNLLPKIKRHLVLSDTPTPSLFSIDDDTQKQEVISVGASIQAKCNEFLTLNLSTTIQGQDDSKRDPIVNRIPRKVVSALPRAKPDIEDDITVDHSLLTSSGADTSLEARLAILFVSSTTTSCGVEILHAPDLSEDLTEITETRAVKERNNTFLSMWGHGVEELEELGKDSNTIQQVVHGCNPPTLSTFQCAQFLAGVLRITPTTNLNDVSQKSYGFATLSLLPKPDATAYSSSSKSSEDAECEADTILGVAASQQARPDTTIESARSIPNAVAFNEFLCNWMFFILLNVKFKETGIILFDALWSIFLSCNTLAFRRRATKDLPVSPWLFFTLTQWVDRSILVLLSSCRKNKIIRKVKTGNFDVLTPIVAEFRDYVATIILKITEYSKGGPSLLPTSLYDSSDMKKAKDALKERDLSRQVTEAIARQSKRSAGGAFGSPGTGADANKRQTTSTESTVRFLPEHSYLTTAMLFSHVLSLLSLLHFSGRRHSRQPQTWRLYAPSHHLEQGRAAMCRPLPRRCSLPSQDLQLFPQVY